WAHSSRARPRRSTNTRSSSSNGRGNLMMKLMLNLPTFGFVVFTRAMIGAGVGLLVSERLPKDRRRVIGAALLAIGAASTVPAVFAILRGRRAAERAEPPRISAVV